MFKATEVGKKKEINLLIDMQINVSLYRPQSSNKGVIQSAECTVKLEAMTFLLARQKKKKCKQTELLSERKSYEEKNTVHEIKLNYLIKLYIYILSKSLI